MTASDLYARANEAADIERLAGVPLRRAGRRMRGECPLCGASKGKKTGGAFSVDPQARRWLCWACGEKGDGVDLAAALWGMTPREAAEQLAGATVPGSASPARAARPAAVPDVRPDDSDWAAKLAAELWKTAKPAARSPVETYLKARGLFGPVLEAALARLRFHPAAYHSGPAQQAVRLPAMVAIVHAPCGSTGGVHVTYLAPDGLGKTKRDPAKKMWGPQAREGQPGGAWLAAPTGEGELIVAEGIESALSAAILRADEAPGPRRVVAALSLGRLQGGLASDRFGRRDPDMPTPDPDSPAFTWPEPADAPWGSVVVAVDRDMRPVTVKTRKAMGGTYDRRIDGDARAQICGALAIAAWKRAGASAARTIAPGPGRDFNDELRARLEAGTVGRAA